MQVRGRIGSQNAAGFTALETLIVVFIIAVIAALVIPQISGARRMYHLDTSAHQLGHDLNLARIEAIKRNRSVYLAKTGSQKYEIQFVGVRELAGAVRFSGGPDTVKFASFGPPLTPPATFTLGMEGETRRVQVNASGFVSIP